MQTHPVVPFDPRSEKIILLDFTAANETLTDKIVNDTTLFSRYVDDQRRAAGARYGIGGYDEHRTVYSRSKVFDNAEEPRRLHLGIDVWGEAGTPVYAPINGTVHSFAFNDRYGDYGATIILKHETAEETFHTLYGHLSLRDLDGLREGDVVKAGACIAHFGEPHENGHWPPHLHFQLINNMGEWKGDYPGVCRFSERETYLHNCADPDRLLKLMQYAVLSK